MDELFISSGSFNFCDGVWRCVVITVRVTVEYPYWKSVLEEPVVGCRFSIKGYLSPDIACLRAYFMRCYHLVSCTAGEKWEDLISEK